MTSPSTGEVSVIPVDGGLGSTLFSATFLPERCVPLGFSAHMQAANSDRAPCQRRRWDMKVILFGATGMIGQAALRESLLDPEGETVLAVVRTPTGERHEKLRELVHADFSDLSPVRDQLTGLDACLFCLGVSSAGMSEADYRHVTYDITLSAAQLLAAQNPGLTFVYVSGAGTDNTERGRSMWARVKGETENGLLALP